MLMWNIAVELLRKQDYNEPSDGDWWIDKHSSTQNESVRGSESSSETERIVWSAQVFKEAQRLFKFK